MNCPECNAEVLRNQLNCEKCGKELEIEDLDSLTWYPIYSTEVEFEADIELGSLESADIPAKIVSSSSSMHLPGGSNALFKIFVPEPYMELATKLIKNSDNV